MGSADEWIPLGRAVAKYAEHVGRDELFTVLVYLLRDGSIETQEPAEGDELPAPAERDVWVLAMQVQAIAAQLDRRQWEALRGRPIMLLRAARNYNVPLSTLQRWLERGFLRELPGDGFRRFLDEADVAFVSVMWQKVGKHGRALFPLLSLGGI